MIGAEGGFDIRTLGRYVGPMRPVPRLLRLLLLLRRWVRRRVEAASLTATILVIPGPSTPTRTFSVKFGTFYLLAGVLAASLLLNTGLLLRNLFVSADYASAKSDLARLRAEKRFLERNLDRLAGRVGEIRQVLPRLLDATESGPDRNFDLFAMGGGDSVTLSNADVSARLAAQVAQVDRDLTISADVLQRVRNHLEMNKRLFSRLPTLWPVPGGGYITSEFGVRNSPFHYDKQESHKGIDIAYYPGAPIVAAADGKVVSAGYEKGFGNCVTILHDFGITTRYAHCQSIRVSAGQPVRRGQVIATMGRTGRTTGCHLHYEVRIGREAVDPMSFIIKTARKGP